VDSGLYAAQSESGFQLTHRKPHANAIHFSPQPPAPRDRTQSSDHRSNDRAQRISPAAPPKHTGSRLDFRIHRRLDRKPTAQDFSGLIMTNETSIMTPRPPIFCFRGFDDTHPYPMSEEEFRNSEVLTTIGTGIGGYFTHQVIHAGRIVKVLQCPADALDALMATGVQA
jgi:hypothetical protein